MTPGQSAYERDLAQQPSYHDDSKRPTWDKLGAIARWSWERNPTDRIARSNEQMRPA
jgi:hypothetical protein